MSYSEFRDQKAYDDIIEKQLTAERIKTEEHLADINEQLRDLIGSRVRASTGLQALNEKTKCKGCNLIASLVHSQLCYHCYSKRHHTVK